MKYVRLLIGRPGIYLLLMFLWILPFMTRDILYFKKHNFDINIRLLNLYIVPYVLCIVAMLTLNVISTSLNCWVNLKIWSKYATLIISYSLVIYLSGIMTVVLHEHGYIDYGGDVFGTIVMGYWPSVFLYIIIGIPITIYFGHKTKRKNYSLKKNNT